MGSIWTHTPQHRTFTSLLIYQCSTSAALTLPKSYGFEMFWNSFPMKIATKCTTAWWWLEPWNFIFANSWDDDPIWRTHMFHDGYCTTNQTISDWYFIFFVEALAALLFHCQPNQDSLFCRHCGTKRGEALSVGNSETTWPWWPPGDILWISI